MILIIVGEKLNSSIPSVLRAFDAKDEAAVRELIKRQMGGDAEYLDVNAAACMERELDTLIWAAKEAVAMGGKVMIDSPNADVVEKALSALSLRDTIINSVTLESDRFSGVMSSVKKYNTRIVALPIDDSGIPDTAESRTELSCELIEKIREFGVRDEDIFLDVLIQTLGTDSSCGKVVLDTIRNIRAKYPDIHIIGGLSNISFGLPKRAVINGAFLSSAITCGLDSAIMDSANTELLMTMRAALLANGYDEYCMDYLDAYRAFYEE